MCKIKEGWNLDMILDSIFNPNSTVLPIIKDSAQYVLNGSIPYPKDFDANAWEDTIVAEEDEMLAKKENNAILGHLW